MKRPVLATLVALLGACFDPLYEDPDALGEGSWAVCCVRNQVDTCLCEAPHGCDVAFQACAAGTCTPSLRESCESIHGTQDAGAGSDAGSPTDAGTTTDGGASTEDGGSPTDAGTPTDGGTDAGTPPVNYEPCCDPLTHRVTTCRCEPTGCSGAAFSPCASGRCAPNGESCG
ncbi:hypothetical protein ACIHQR_11485 [Corallococcus coralloides]|uniref:hypothetical protein n=1 Tax=Corallococcus coralloides TaxID=184914 RepID=UPI00384BF2C4